MAVAESTSRDTLPAALPGVGRALVLAGKLTQKVAEDTFRKALAGQKNFISELIESGAIGLIGGLIGVVVSFILSLLLNYLPASHVPWAVERVYGVNGETDAHGTASARLQGNQWLQSS